MSDVTTNQEKKPVLAAVKAHVQMSRRPMLFAAWGDGYWPIKTEL
jgi:hypothetical protein